MGRKIKRSKKGSKQIEILRKSEGRMRFRSNFLFKNKHNGYHGFVDNLLKVNGVTGVDVNPFLKSIRVLYNSYIIEESILVQRIEKEIEQKEKHEKVFSSISSTPFLSNPRLCNGNRIKFNRLDDFITGWNIVNSLPGRLRAKHFVFKERLDYLEVFEKKLLGIPEFKNFSVSQNTGSVLVIYEKGKTTHAKAVRILEEILSAVVDECKGLRKRDKINKMAICTGVMMMSAVGEMLFPWLFPLNLLLILFISSPILKDAWAAIRKRTIKVDILDATVIILCLTGGQLFAAAFMVWIVNFAKSMLDRTSDESRKLLTQVYSAAPRFAWIEKDGVEIQVPVERLVPGCEVVIFPGEAIPVDGVVSRGDAMIDQHALTGESAPVEKKEGDKVFASTVVIAGKIYCKVEEVGSNTRAAKIIEIIENSVNHKTKVHSIGERLADKMVLPTLALAALGLPLVGLRGVLAIVNCDYGTGIRIAAPLAVLSSVANAARNGILIKNSKVLEDITSIDAILFDKTGTLTHEIPEVVDIIKNNGHFNDRDILMYAATAEQKFSHPIAKAILKRAESEKLKLSKIDESKCRMGYGIEVGINGDIVKVGSIRYMQKEGIVIPSHVEEKLQNLHKIGGSAVMVAVNNNVAGALELRSSHRPEAYDMIKNLRKRGVKELILISGDHKAATKHISEQLGMDRYFAEVLPMDKGNYVKMLQKEGKKVAMVGDGINDAVALSLADVSVSMRGASDIATDMADVVLMDGTLQKFELLFDISKKMQRNIKRSFAMIVIPNTIGIFGAMTGIVGLFHSLILNNGFNILATLNGMTPFYESCNDEEKHKEILETSLNKEAVNHTNIITVKEPALVAVS